MPIQLVFATDRLILGWGEPPFTLTRYVALFRYKVLIFLPIGDRLFQRSTKKLLF